MDSHDLWVFRGILQAGYRPRVITTEYNANYPITDAITLLDSTIVGNTTYLANFKYKFSGCAWGAGAGAFRIVAEAHGYTMIGRVGALDLIWLRSDLLIKDCFEVPPFEWFFRGASIGRLYHGRQSSPDILSRIVDYKTYIFTEGNLTASQNAARAILKKRQLACYKGINDFL